jgi:hypothetical protein
MQCAWLHARMLFSFVCVFARGSFVRVVCLRLCLCSWLLLLCLSFFRCGSHSVRFVALSRVGCGLKAAGVGAALAGGSIIDRCKASRWRWCCWVPTCRPLFGGALWPPFGGGWGALRCSLGLSLLGCRWPLRWPLLSLYWVPYYPIYIRARVKKKTEGVGAPDTPFGPLIQGSTGGPLP